MLACRVRLAGRGEINDYRPLRFQELLEILHIKRKGENCMIKVQASIVINTTPENIFAAMIDTKRHREFVYNYVDQYDGPEFLSAGTYFHWHMRLYGLTLRVHSLVSAFDPPGQYQETICINGFMKAILTKTMETDKGGTLLTWTWEYVPAFGILGKIVDRIIGGQGTARKGVEESLKMIKAVIELRKE